MKAVCERRDLYHGVQAVSRAIAGRSAWPILNNVLVRTEEGCLRLTGFDLELGIECTVPASIEKEGALTVPAKLINEVLGNLPEARVQVSEDEHNSVNITCERSDYTVLGLPAEEFRTLPEVPEGLGFSIPQNKLQEMIRHTLFAVSPDESRPILTGVLLSLEENLIRLVSTDTHRLAMRTSEVAGASGTATRIVPKRALDELSRLLNDDDSPVVVSIADAQIKFEANGITIVSRLIDGQFPNYERVIPENSQKRLTIPTDEFLAQVRRCSIVAREDANRVVVHTEGDRLISTAQSGEVGRAYEEIEIVTEGEDMKIAFNAKYLSEFLAVVGSEGVFMDLAGSLSPGLLKPVGREDYVYVLMPMQIM